LIEKLNHTWSTLLKPILKRNGVCACVCVYRLDLYASWWNLV